MIVVLNRNNAVVKVEDLVALTSTVAVAVCSLQRSKLLSSVLPCCYVINIYKSVDAHWIESNHSV